MEWNNEPSDSVSDLPKDEWLEEVMDVYGERMIGCRKLTLQYGNKGSVLTCERKKS